MIMMELFSHLATGFTAAVSPINLMLCFVGVLTGTLIGVLPGIGPLATIAMLLPITFGLEPLSGLIMLAGIYYGAQYGGSTTAILVNLPGESSSIVTCLDGHQMAKQGRAGVALSIAALGSLFAGIFSTGVIAMFGPVLANVANDFNSPEFFSLMLFGLVAAVIMARGSASKAAAMIFLGLLLSLVGLDNTANTFRYTFNLPALYEGVDIVAMSMGMIGLAEIIVVLEKKLAPAGVVATTIRNLWPRKDDFRAAWPASLRGTALGSVLGLLPGGGGVLSSFASYALEKRISKTPERFGEGAIEGLAGPESANNAGAQTSFIPMLTMGIPFNPIMALMMGAMLVHGITPGTAVMVRHPELFWGLVVSMLIGNFLLVLINLPLVGIWVRLLQVPYRYLFPSIVVFCCIGLYTVNFQTFDLIQLAIFTVFGYILNKLRCEPAPFLIAFILGPQMEENLRRSMALSRGDPSIFVTQPISLILLLMTLGLLILILFPKFRSNRERLFD